MLDVYEPTGDELQVKKKKVFLCTESPRLKAPTEDE
jgi:hypothetical protein